MGDVTSHEVTCTVHLCNRVFRGYGFHVLASFIARARGIKLYGVDCRTLVPSLSVALQRKRSRYDAAEVGLLVPSRRYGLGTVFLRHME